MRLHFPSEACNIKGVKRDKAPDRKQRSELFVEKDHGIIAMAMTYEITL